MRRTPALIVGGGPAGSAAAIALARGGLETELVERSAGERDVVCGGFISWEALGALDRLGLDPFALGAHPIDRLRLIGPERTVETDLPHRAAGLSRRRLDAALLDAAAQAGARLRLGRAVRAVDRERLSVRLEDGEELAAESLILASGKHDVRGAPREAAPHAGAVGIRTSIPDPGGLDNVIELHLFDGGYAGLLLQEDGRANLCLSIERTRLSAAGGLAALTEELARERPQLGVRLAAACGEWDTIAGVPYGWRAGAAPRGLFRIGDQAAVIASLVGDGVAIALASGRAAAEAILRDGPPGSEAYQRRFAARAARPLQLAEMLRHAAESPRWRPAMMRMVQFAPALAPLAARLTRIAG